MKRILVLAVALMLILALAMAGCLSNQETSDQENEIAQTLTPTLYVRVEPDIRVGHFQATGVQHLAAWPIAIVGVAINRTNHNIPIYILSFNIYNERGYRIGQVYDVITNLSAGALWAFTATGRIYRYRPHSFRQAI